MPVKHYHEGGFTDVCDDDGFSIDTAICGKVITYRYTADFFAYSTDKVTCPECYRLLHRIQKIRIQAAAHFHRPWVSFARGHDVVYGLYTAEIRTARPTLDRLCKLLFSLGWRSLYDYDSDTITYYSPHVERLTRKDN